MLYRYTRAMQNEPTNTELLYAIVDLKDAMLAGFERHDLRFDAVDLRLDTMDRRLGRIETRIEDLERRLPA